MVLESWKHLYCKEYKQLKFDYQTKLFQFCFYLSVSFPPTFSLLLFPVSSYSFSHLHFKPQISVHHVFRVIQLFFTLSSIRLFSQGLSLQHQLAYGASSSAKSIASQEGLTGPTAKRASFFSAILHLNWHWPLEEQLLENGRQKNEKENGVWDEELSREMRTELSPRERGNRRPKNNDPLEHRRKKCSQHLRKLSRDPQKVISIMIDKIGSNINYTRWQLWRLVI